MLYNPRYSGFVEWGKYRPAHRRGTKARERQQAENLVRSLEEGGRDEKPLTLVKGIAKLEANIAARERELWVLDTGSTTELEVARLERTFRSRLDQFNDLPLPDVPRARQALRKLRVGRIRFVRTERHGQRAYHLQWSPQPKPLMDEVHIPVASPR